MGAETGDWHDQLVELLPQLRRFAFSLTGSVHDADDLLQATVEKALRNECATIAYTALHIARERLNCGLPAEVPAALGVARLRRAMIDRLSARLSLDDYGPVFNARWRLMGRAINQSLLLPYLNMQPDQIGRRLSFVLRTRREEVLRTLP